MEIRVEANESRSAIVTAGKTVRTRNISQRVRRIVISPIKEMSILADEEVERTGADIISFGQGIPYLDTPAHIKTAIREALDDPETAKYTLEPGITELRHAIAQYLRQEKGIRDVRGKHEIMVTVGCQEAIACALASLIDDGDEVLLPSPCFASHTEQIIQFGGVPKFVPLIEEEGWRLDLDACARAVTPKTRAILFSNPSNPTGAVLSVEDIRGLAQLAIAHDLVIVTDETYDFLTYDGVVHASPAAIPDVRDRVIVCGSFSKKYAMTGYRVGYAFADEGIIDHMLKVHDALAICCPAISQRAALAAIQGPQECVGHFRAAFDQNRKVLCDQLDGMVEFCSYVRPRGAYYVLVKLHAPQVRSFPLALRLLREAHVIVVPGAAFGEGGEGHIRLSFAGMPDRLVDGCKRIRGWMEQWRSSGYLLS